MGPNGDGVDPPRPSENPINRRSPSLLQSTHNAAQVAREDVQEEAPPPSYWQEDRRGSKTDIDVVNTSGPGMTSQAVIDESGQVDISLKLHKKLPDLHEDYSLPIKEHGVDTKGWKRCPELNVVIFIVGSRGDVQPYVSLALELIRSNAHRVRIATHGEFESLVKEANKSLVGLRDRRGDMLEGKLEFFDVGGDPKELMAYMVKNPGLLPGYKSLTNGDIPSKRKMTADMLRGFYRATFCPDTVSGQSFAADAIISNPPAFAHVHVAEALGLPLLMSFTMPWSPTTAFRHPLANIRETNAEPGLSNYLTYSLVDILTWQGLGGVINKFRTKVLGLNDISSRIAPSIMDRLKVPWTYCWSESLVPKPRDWKENIDISGFYFYETNSGYKPDADLLTFLKEGPPPVYIGFGSIVIDDPKKMTDVIFEAVQKTGVRALISAGWAGLGDGVVPPGVFVIKGNIPHDWLFAEGRVAAVCHHGGAGTAAIGLRNGLPTIVVPFFGDQKFWGEMVHSRGAGPAPIPYKQVSVEALASALEFVVTPEAQEAAQAMGEQIRSEAGERKGVDSFHRHLPLLNMRCDIDPSRVAIWWSDDLCLKISGAAAGLLASQGKINIKKLTPHRPREYDTARHYSNPWAGGVGGVFHMLTYSISSIFEIFYKPARGTLNTFWGIPKAGMNIIGDLYEGFDNVPFLIGSEVREKGKVTNFTSGLKEGGKCAFWGIADAISGLVIEPIAAAKKEGPKGIPKGFARSYITLLTRPSAGALGLFVLPAIGISRSTAALFHKSPEGVMVGPRTDLSRSAAKQLTPAERENILRRFAELEPLSKTRRNKMRWKAKRWVLLPEKEKEEIEFFADPEADRASGENRPSRSEGDKEDRLSLNSEEERMLIERVKEASLLAHQAEEEGMYAYDAGVDGDIDEEGKVDPDRGAPVEAASWAESSFSTAAEKERSDPVSGGFANTPGHQGETLGPVQMDEQGKGKGKGREKARASTVPTLSTSTDTLPSEPSTSGKGADVRGGPSTPASFSARSRSPTPLESTSGESGGLGYQRRKAERDAYRRSSGWG